MRIATFNILHGRRSHDGPVDLDAFREAITALDADVLALQEVDHLLERSHTTDLTAAAAEAMGAVEHRFVAALNGSPGATWTAATGAELPDSAGYGIALLTRVPVTSWHVVRLPVLHGRAPTWFSGARRPSLARDEPRVAMAACVDAAGGPLTVVNTHLSFIPWWGARQLRSLMGSVRAMSGPVVLAGDLNMGPERVARLTGMRSLAAAPTFPADSPREQLDHLLLAGDGRASGAHARRLGVSDHRALVVDLD